MDKDEKTIKLAKQILGLARDHIIMNLRFMDSALAALDFIPRPGLEGIAAQGSSIYYDPVYLLKHYREEHDYAVRLYLHILLHFVFYHSFQYDRTQTDFWDLAADIAAENAVLEMKLYGASLKKDEELRLRLQEYRNQIGLLTAEKLYRHFIDSMTPEWELLSDAKLFRMDLHIFWQEPEQFELSQDQFQRISERIKADLKSFSKNKNNSESMEQNLEEATKERYNYEDILRRFTVMGETVTVNEDEFDYVYYTYGLSQYGNMPLVEPLEYKEVHKIKEFIIALDTSASCRGDLVRAFLQKTYSILKGEETFFQKINVHIIQCDSDIQSDTKITSDEEFDYFLSHGKLYGFGSTDFRPVFEYVDGLIAEKEFENLKGLIYFTDGYGLYPTRMPPYDVIFAFLNKDDTAPEIPSWAIKVILERDSL